MRHGLMVFDWNTKSSNIDKFFMCAYRRLVKTGVLWLRVQPKYGFVIVALKHSKNYLIATDKPLFCFKAPKTIIPTLVHEQNDIDPYTASMICEIFRRLFKNGYTPFFNFNTGRPC